MYDFDIFKFDTSIVGLSAGNSFLAKLFFQAEKLILNKNAKMLKDHA